MLRKQSASKISQKWYRSKKLWIISAASLLLVLSVLIGKPLYDTYHDRPFNNGLQYIGRDYHSGCFLVESLCFGPTTERFYFATDVEPKDIVSMFPGWKLDSEEPDKEILWDDVSVSNSIAYTLSKKGDIATYAYIKDKALVSSISKLLPTNRKYVIWITPESYSKLSER